MLIFSFLINLINHDRENTSKYLRIVWGGVKKIKGHRKQKCWSLWQHLPGPALRTTSGCSPAPREGVSSPLPLAAPTSHLKPGVKRCDSVVLRNWVGSFLRCPHPELFPECVLIATGHFHKLSLKCGLQPQKTRANYFIQRG